MNKDYTTPFGLSKWTLLYAYATFMFLYSNILGSPDLVIRLLKMNKTATNYSESELVQKQWINSIANRGFLASTASSIVVTSFTNYYAPRNTVILAAASFTVGLILMFLADDPLINTAGAILTSITFTFSTVCHLQISALWPPNSELVQDVIGNATEASSLIPYIILWISMAVDAEKPVETAVQIFLAFFAIVVIFQFILIPSEPFELLCKEEFLKKLEAVPKRKHVWSAKLARTKLVRLITEKTSIDIDSGAYLLDNLTVIEQAIHPLFWFIAAISSIAMLIRYHLLSTFRYTIMQYAKSSGYQGNLVTVLPELLNIVNGFTWITNCYFTRVASITTSFVMSLLMMCAIVISLITLAIPNLHVQFITIIMYWIFGTLPYNYIFCAIIEYFGTNHINAMQGILLLVGGVVTGTHVNIMSWLDEPFIDHEVISELGLLPTYKIFGTEFAKFKVVNFAFLIVALVLLASLYYEYILLVNRKNTATKEDKEKLINNRDSAQYESKLAGNKQDQNDQFDFNKMKELNIPNSKVISKDKKFLSNELLKQLSPSDTSNPSLDSIKALKALSELLQVVENEPTEANFKKCAELLNISPDILLNLGKQFQEGDHADFYYDQDYSESNDNQTNNHIVIDTNNK